MHVEVLLFSSDVCSYLFNAACYLDNVDDPISRLTPSEHFSVEDDDDSPLSTLLTKSLEK